MATAVGVYARSGQSNHEREGMIMSNLKLKATPANYAEALEFLNGRVSKKIGHNTDLVKYGKNIRVLYHGNVIATYYRDAGTVKNSTEVPIVSLRTAGWNSVTTTRRLSMLLTAALEKVDNAQFGGGIGIKNGAAELRVFRHGQARQEYAQSIVGAAVNVYGDGYFGVKVDVEGARFEMTAEEAADRLPF